MEIPKERDSLGAGRKSFRPSRFKIVLYEYRCEKSSDCNHYNDKGIRKKAGGLENSHDAGVIEST